MSSRLTVDQLEQMKTHELADLLANVVLVLRRMPDIPFTQLQTALAEPRTQPAEPIKKRATSRRVNAPTTEAETPLADVNSLTYTGEELRHKTVPELKKIAVAMHITTSAKKKGDLVGKILARQGNEHSEQFAIQNL